MAYRCKACIALACVAFGCATDAGAEDRLLSVWHGLGFPCVWLYVARWGGVYAAPIVRYAAALALVALAFLALVALAGAASTVSAACAVGCTARGVSFIIV